MGKDNRLYEHFSEKELKCRCGQCSMDQKYMSPSFMVKIEFLRICTGVKMPVTSPVRCFKHNLKVSKVRTYPPHVPMKFSGIDDNKPFCHAIDVNVWGADLDKLMNAIYGMKLIGLEFTGIGIKQTGPYNERMLHLDDLPISIVKKRPRIWTYS